MSTSTTKATDLSEYEFDSCRRTLPRYLAGVDGMRALAVVSVVAYHLDSRLLPGGLTGVDVFFVISGYVISKSLSEANANTLTEFLSSFYRRRFIRLLPALVLCLVVSSLIATVIIPDSYLSRSNNGTGFWAFFGLSNFFLLSESDSYFAASIPFNPFVHTWSLAVEEQFYIFFPALAFLWSKKGSHESSWNQPAVLLLIAFIILSLSYSAYSSVFKPVEAFYLLGSRLWELGLGVLVFWMHKSGSWLPTKKIHLELSVYLGLGLVLAGFYIVDTQNFPFPYALLPVVGTVLLICGLVSNESITPTSNPILALLTYRHVVWLGLLSYSLYLWHWPVFTFFQWTIGLETLEQKAFAACLAVVCAVLSYTLVEKPIRYARANQTASNRRVISLSIVGLVVTSTTLHHISQNRESLGLFNSVTIENKCDWKSWIPKGCNVQVPDGFSDLAKGRKLISVGDSHEGAYHRLLELSAKATNAKLLRKRITGCKLLWLAPKTKRVQPCENELRDWVMQNAAEGDIVFLPGLRIVRISDAFGVRDPKAIAQDRKFRESESQLTLGLADAISTLALLEEKGVHVLIEAPKPVFRASAEQCSDWYNQNSKRCSAGFTVPRSFIEAHRSAVMAQLEKVRATTGANVWDPLPQLCDEETCFALLNGRPVFKDGDHLSGHGNDILLPSFLESLHEIWQ